jgi:OMF family outer membrane factor
MNTLVNTHSSNHKSAGVFLLLIGLFFSTGVDAQIWTLQQCLDTAKQQNKNILIARNNIEIGQQKVQEAKANLIPKLSINGDYKYFIELPYQFMPQSAFGGPEGQFKEVQFGVPHNINANLQLTIPLFNPQVHGIIQTTKIASELNSLLYQKSEEQILYEVTNLYYNAQILHYQVAFIDENLINANKLLKNIQLLKDQLLARGTDVSKVQLQMEQLTTLHEQIISKYTQVLNALKITIGIPVDQGLDVDPDIIHSATIEYTQASALDMRLVTKQNALLNSELNTLKNSRLPSLSLYGSYGTTGFGYNKAPNEFLKFYPVSFLGVQLSYPLFMGTTTNRKVSQKKLEIGNNDLQFSLLTELTALGIETAKQQRAVAQRSVETTLRQTALAQSIYDQTLLQQKQGLASLTDVLLADNTLRETQQNHLSALVDYLKADLDLRKSTGNLLNK